MFPSRRSNPHPNKFPTTAKTLCSEQLGLLSSERVIAEQNAQKQQKSKGRSVNSRQIENVVKRCEEHALSHIKHRKYQRRQ